MIWDVLVALVTPTCDSKDSKFLVSLKIFAVHFLSSHSNGGVQHQ